MTTNSREVLMKTLIFFCFSLLFLAGCGSSGGSSSSTSTTCTYQNGAYYVNGTAYASCPSGSTLTSSACTYSNGLYYYNGQGYATCPVNATSGYGTTTGVHNCANLTLMDSYGQVGVCTINYNYCAGYTMYSTSGGGQIYCQ